MYLVLERQSDNGVQTTGVLSLCNPAGKVFMALDTLELTWNKNVKAKSCVPCGTYIIEPHFSFRHGRCFELQSVPDRSNILIHKGNFNKDTKGCILIGKGFKDIDFDFQIDVLNSKLAMEALRKLLTSVTTITIKNKF